MKTKEITFIKKGENTKELGQIFTPTYIVNLILDEIDYKGEKILNQKIIEPSFGDGAFLLEILNRLLSECQKNKKSNQETLQILEENIFGIELDKNLHQTTKNKLNQFLENNNLSKIKWKNILNKNTLEYEGNDFDYVAGNPPYVRTHNITDKHLLNNFKFSGGTTDLYILFFEKCLNLLNDEGKLGFITPNSFFINSSQKVFRNYLIENNLIEHIIDFKDYLVFDKVLTYTAISILNKNRNNNSFKYTIKKGEDTLYETKYNVVEFKKNDRWNFSTEENSTFLSSIKNRKYFLRDFSNIQYGIATNKDALYIGTIEKTNDPKIVLFQNSFNKTKQYEIEASILKDVIKASTFKTNNSKIIFPYSFKDGKLNYIDEEDFKNKFPKTYNYFLEYETELLGRDLNSSTKWYEFGRKQGLINSSRKKLIIKHIFDQNKNNLEVLEVNKNTVVYSGIYITCDDEENLLKIKEILSSEEFCKYAKIVGKNLSGGYKSISTNNIKEFGLL